MFSDTGGHPAAARRRRRARGLLLGDLFLSGLLLVGLPCGGSTAHAGTAHAPPPPLASAPAGGSVSGSLVVWGDVVVDFTASPTSEQAAINPFTDHRLSVLFKHTPTGKQLIISGFYAADGAAADTGASSGGVWRVHLLPDLAGEWTYKASFRTGPMVAISFDPLAGVPTGFDNATGSFTVAAQPPGAAGFHAHGLLAWNDSRYLHFAGSGKPFLKTGTDSPENLLAFGDFDGTPATHAYASHVADWKPFDPTWAGGRGKGLIGALNYLADSGVNSAYFLTFNAGGDGKDVWPWTSATERLRFDVSKLEQWERVFQHMDNRGIMLHVVTQETENDDGPTALDGGELGPQRCLYYRELVARFAHHPALQWSLGEENTNTTAQQLAFITHLRALDPYDHPIVVHTFPAAKAGVYAPLIAAGALEGASLQIAGMDTAHAETATWLDASKAGGRPWVVSLDETGPADTGVVPDSFDPTHDTVRRLALWGNLMAGGAGCEWYFGYAFPHDDLDCEDFRSREALWKQSRIAREFLETQLALDALVPADGLVSAKSVTGLPVTAWCLAQADEEYVVYLPEGGLPKLDLGTATGSFEVRWLDTLKGGTLRTGNVTVVNGPGIVTLGAPPTGTSNDWALVVRRITTANVPPKITGTALGPSPFPGGEDFVVTVDVADANGLADISSVVVHFFAPGLVHVGYAPAAKVGPAQYSMTIPGLPKLPAGQWVAAPLVVDSSGQSAYVLKSFTAL